MTHEQFNNLKKGDRLILRKGVEKNRVYGGIHLLRQMITEKVLIFKKISSGGNIEVENNVYFYSYHVLDKVED